MKSLKHSALDIDYCAYQSKLNDTNVIFKLLFCFIVLIVCVAASDNLLSLYIIISMCVITVAVGKIHFHDYLSAMLIPVGFLVLSTIAVVINITDGISITKAGLLNGINLFLRSLGAVSALYMLIFSTPIADICDGFRKLHMPDIIIELMFLIYRFIFVVYGTVLAMIDAAKARGGYTLKGFGMICSNLLVVSMKKANDTYDSMLARGYDGRLEFYTNNKGVSLTQVIAAVIYLIIMGGILCLK